MSPENRAFIALPDAEASKNMNKNRFIAFTCFAVCFCINKLEKKKKRITLNLSPENLAFIALPSGAVASKKDGAVASKKKVRGSTFSLLSMPPLVLVPPRDLR